VDVSRAEAQALLDFARAAGILADVG